MAPAATLDITIQMITTTFGSFFSQTDHAGCSRQTADEYLSLAADVPELHLERRSQRQRDQTAGWKYSAEVIHVFLAVPNAPAKTD